MAAVDFEPFYDYSSGDPKFPGNPIDPETFHTKPELLNPTVAPKITRVCKICPLETMNLCIKFHGNASPMFVESCQSGPQWSTDKPTFPVW